MKDLDRNMLDSENIAKARRIKYICSLFYPVQIIRVAAKSGKMCYFAYFPDFGPSVCSATGDTIKETLQILDEIKKKVITFMVTKDKPIPKPSNNLFFLNIDN